jgi:hypothetical protein
MNSKYFIGIEKMKADQDRTFFDFVLLNTLNSPYLQCPLENSLSKNSINFEKRWHQSPSP